MSQHDWLVLMGMGGLFILLGLLAILWSKHEQGVYDNALLGRMDKREFFDHWPPRPEPGSAKVGGWIAIILGLIVIIMASLFLLFV
jgi:hypothetical protein